MPPTPADCSPASPCSPDEIRPHLSWEKQLRAPVSNRSAPAAEVAPKFHPHCRRDLSHPPTAACIRSWHSRAACAASSPSPAARKPPLCSSHTFAKPDSPPPVPPPAPAALPPPQAAPLLFSTPRKSHREFSIHPEFSPSCKKHSIGNSAPSFSIAAHSVLAVRFSFFAFASN